MEESIASKSASDDVSRRPLLSSRSRPPSYRPRSNRAVGSVDATGGVRVEDPVSECPYVCVEEADGTRTLDMDVVRPTDLSIDDGTLAAACFAVRGARGYEGAGSFLTIDFSGRG